MDVMPRIDSAGRSAFTPEGDRAAYRRSASSIEGQFKSYFADKDNPLLAESKDRQAGTIARRQSPDETKKTDAGVISSIIDKSPESARLFVFGSNTFLSDQTLSMIGSAEGTVYGNSLQLIANAVDWSLEDRGLLAIRSRGHFNRTLPPLAGRRSAGRSNIPTTASHSCCSGLIFGSTARVRKRAWRSTTRGSTQQSSTRRHGSAGMNRHVKSAGAAAGGPTARARRNPVRGNQRMRHRRRPARCCRSIVPRSTAS